jgi:tetratricopeptide (TPR) repeat protein
MLVLLVLAFAPQPDPAALRRIFEDALHRRERQYGVTDRRTAQAARDLGMFLAREGDAAAARVALAEALRADEAELGASSTQTLADAAALASVSPPGQAEPLWHRATESADAGVAVSSLAALGGVRAAAGDRAGAAGFYRRALSRQEAASGADSEPVALRLNALALVVDPKDGIPLLQRALAIDRRVLGSRHPQTATTEANLAGLLVHTQRHDEALAAAAEALAVFGETLGMDHPRCAVAASILALALEAKGERARAEKMYRMALEIDRLAYGPKHPQTLKDQRALDDFLRAR